QRLDAVRAPVLGVILNGVDIDNPDYAYYRHYYGSNYASSEYEAENSTEPTIDMVAEKKQHEITPQIDDQGQGTVHGSNFGAVAEEPGNSEKTNSGAIAQAEPLGQGQDTVSQDSFRQMNSKLDKVAGPLASAIIGDQIDTLRKFRETFPKSSVEELLKKV